MQKEKNMSYQGQNMKFDSAGPEEHFMQSMRFPPPHSDSDRQFFTEESRKRKSMAMDLGSYPNVGISPRFLGNPEAGIVRPLQRESASQHNVVLSQTIGCESKAQESFLNCNSQLAKPRNVESQYENFQFYNIGNSLVGSEKTDESIKNTAFGSFQSWSFHRKEPSFSIKTPVGEISRLHAPQQSVFERGSQPEPRRFIPYYEQSTDQGCVETSQAAPISNRETNLGQGNHGNYNLPYDPFLYQCSAPANLTTMESSHKPMINQKFHSDGGTFVQNFSKSGLDELKTSGQVHGVGGDSNTSIGTTNSTKTSAANEGRETCGFSQFVNSELSPRDFTVSDVLGAYMNVGAKEQGGSVVPQMSVPTESCFSEQACVDVGMLRNNTDVSSDLDTQVLENNDGSNDETKRQRCPSGNGGSSPKSYNSHASGPVEPGNGVDGLSSNLEEQSKSLTGKASPTVTEKLWDGSLQLNTSTTVSALAFFKSGEKAQDINWPEHVETKGKVRMQAFEKFIQELPRSRNRALMVVSLCWKVDSSKAGLEGMKEVAKGYRESGRVGFAQICPGFDLYVCPRSDTIITILAKYGFFKGMAAVEEDQDSLIGCIVWRRGNPSLHPIPKNSERKKNPLPEQPLNSPELYAPEMNSPITHVHDPGSKQEKSPSPLISESKSALQNAIPMMNEKKFSQTANDSSHCGSGTNSVPEITLSVPYNSPLIPVQPPSPRKPESTSFNEIVKPAEIPTIQAVEQKKPDDGVELVQPIFPGAPQIFQGFQQQADATFNIDSYNIRNYSSGPVPKLRPLVSLDSPITETQMPITEKPDWSSGQNPLQDSSKTELKQLVLPGPPPLPEHVLQRLIQFRRDASKASTVSPVMHIGSIEKHIGSIETHIGEFQTKRSSNLDDNDDDLPEFDFDFACGVPKAPTSKFAWSSHGNHFPDAAPFQKHVADAVKNVSGPLTPPAVKPIEGSCFTTYQELKSEKKPVAAQISCQVFTVQSKKDSSSSSISAPKSRWDDDDDDMPEWCPPDMESIDQPPRLCTSAGLHPPLPPRPGTENAAKQQPIIPALPSPSTSLYQPLQSHTLHHEYMPGLVHPRPANSCPVVPVQTRSAAGFIRSDPKPPQMPHPNHSLRPPTNIGTKPATSDATWVWGQH